MNTPDSSLSASIKESLEPAKAQLALAESYRRVFAAGDGETVLTDLLRRAGMLEVATVEGDPFATHFRDGRRSLALEIVAQLRFTESELLRLALQRTAIEEIRT